MVLTLVLTTSTDFPRRWLNTRSPGITSSTERTGEVTLILLTEPEGVSGCCGGAIGCSKAVRGGSGVRRASASGGRWIGSGSVSRRVIIDGGRPALMYARWATS